MNIFAFILYQFTLVFVVYAPKFSYPQPCRIAVIGAGVSGLSAAKTIKETSSCDVYILEARDRIGGRVHSNQEFGVEIGAGWIHGTNLGNSAYKIAVENNIETLVVDGDEVFIGGRDSMKVFSSAEGRFLSDTERNEGFVLVDEITHTFTQKQDINIRRKINSLSDLYSSDKLCDALHDITTSMSLNNQNHLFLKWYSEISYGGNDAADPCWLGFEAYHQFWHNLEGEDSVVPNGYFQIPLAMSRNLKIKLNQEVTVIEKFEDSYFIKTKDGLEHWATHVIVTVPSGVLKANKIKFVPELPENLYNALFGQEMGVLNRIALKFVEPFWPKDQYAFGYISVIPRRWPMIVNQYPVTRRPILEFMVGGKEALRVENLTDSEIVVECVQVSEEMFGIYEMPVDYVISRWNKDPYTLGSYSYLPPHYNPSLKEVFDEPVNDGTLMFAGEAIEIHFSGTVHGAIDSGKKAAQILLNRINR